MRALVITAPGRAEVQEVPSPTPGPGEVVVDVDRAGICGTDIEIFHGEMAYLRSGHARCPMRIGHEWTGIVASVGAGTDTGWIGRRVMGDTMLGCGSCRRCRRGNQHVCAERIGRAHVWTPVTWPARMPSSAGKTAYRRSLATP